MLRITPLIQERIKLLRDVLTVADFFFVDQLPPYDTAELIPQEGRCRDGAARPASEAREVLADAEFTHDALEAALRAAAGALGIKAGQMFEPIRVAVCGRKNAPPLFRHAGSAGPRDLPGAHRRRPSKNCNRSMIREYHRTPTPTGAFELHPRHHPRRPEDQQVRRPRAHALSAGAERLPAHRPRQVDLPEFRPGRGIRRQDAICASTTPIPSKEETEYVDSIIEDVRWLGFDWEDRLFYASDYFDQLYEWAVQLIQAGKAYVCDLTAEQIREYRGTLTEPGKESPYRNRTVEENLDLFERMKAGEFPDGSRTLRAKIDMASPNLNMRDPVMYRILHAEHHRTGDKWCIYPMYDFAHGAVGFDRSASRTPSARWNSKTTARSTTGTSSSSASTIRSRSSSTA